MRLKHLSVLVVLALVPFVSAGAAEKQSGFGGALVAGTLDCESCSDTFEFSGFSLFGKIGFNKNWGLLITYRDAEDDEDFLFNETDSYTQLAVQAVYMWRPSKMFRPHVKFGFESTDFEAEAPGFPTVSDDGTALAVGGGFEAGSQSVAFFLDYDFTTVELFDEDFDIDNLSLGIIFKL